MATAVSGLAFSYYTPAYSQETAQVAQPTQSAGLEEIVVSARARNETQIEVPISVRAYTAETIALDNLTDLHAMQAEGGFTFQESASTAAGGRNNPGLIMRGLQSTYGGGQSNSGSLFVDGIYISAGQSSINTADVKQVEILKGPQNVYFGKNTFGGAINFITSTPSNQFAATVDASGTMRGSSDVNLMVEGPLVDGLLRGRIAVQDYVKAAQYHATDGGELGAEATRGVTGTLYATPTDTLWLRFRGHYQQDDDSEADLGFIPGSVYGTNCNAGKGTTASGAPATVVLQSPYFCGKIPNLAQVGGAVLDQNTTIPAAFATSQGNNSWGGVPDPVLAQTPSLTHAGLRRNLLGLAAQGGYDLPYGAMLGLNIGYNESQSDAIWDLDRSTNGVFFNGQPLVSSDLTLDTRVTSDQTQVLRGVIGFSYFHSNYQAEQDADNYYNYAPVAARYVGTTLTTSSYQNEDDDIKALYGSIEYDFLSWLTGTIEGRYQHDELIDKLYNNTGQYGKTFNNILPRFILKAHPETNWTFYGSYSEGLQPANLQTAYINASAVQRAYISTVLPGASPYSALPHLRSQEIGAKQVLFDNRFEYEIAFYHEKWLHQLTSAAVFNPAGCGLTAVTAACPLGVNGALLYLPNDADIKGIEFSANGQITDQLTANLSLDYKHSIWTDYYNSTLKTFTNGVTSFNGNQISRQPALQGSVSATYRDHFIGDWDWYAHAQMTYTGSMYESEVNIAKSNAYERVNAAFGFKKGDMSIEVYGKNLTDDKNWDWASRVPELQNIQALNTGFAKYMGVLVQPPDRLDIGVKVHYKFGNDDQSSTKYVAPAMPMPEPAPAPMAAPVATAKVEAQRSFQVFFDFDKSDITSAAMQVIQAAADAVKAGNVVTVNVIGHTDTVGSAAYNQGLSERRADAVKAALIADGVSGGEITTMGVGKTGLLVPTGDGVREPQNRRAEIVLK